MPDLSVIEVLALKGISARDREIQELYVKPLRADFQSILAVIEERLQIKLGQTHELNLESLRLYPIDTVTETVVEAANYEIDHHFGPVS